MVGCALRTSSSTRVAEGGLDRQRLAARQKLPTLNPDVGLALVCRAPPPPPPQTIVGFSGILNNVGWGLGRGLAVGRLGVEGRGEALKLEGLSFPGFVAPWPGGQLVGYSLGKLCLGGCFVMNF